MEMASKTGQAQLGEGIHPPKIVPRGPNSGQFQLVKQIPVNPLEGVTVETIGLNTGPSRLEGEALVMNPPGGVAGVTMGSNTGQSRLEGQVPVMISPEGVAGVTMGSNTGQAQPGGVTVEVNPAVVVVAGNEVQGFRNWAEHCGGRVVSSAVDAATAALWDCLCGRGGEEEAGDDCCFCV